MAIPFNLPSDEQTEDNYRRLDQLLRDLYGVLRQILIRRPTQVPEQHRPTEPDGHGGAGAAGPAPSGSRQVACDVSRSRPLPDVVSSTLSCQCPCQRRRPLRRHRRRRRPNCGSLESPTCSSPAQRPDRRRSRPEESWLAFGEHLRKIAEEFKTSFSKQEVPREQKEDLKMEVKTSGLFSLLVPGHFRSSLWTTVILLVGWRLLVRAR